MLKTRTEYTSQIAGSRNITTYYSEPNTPPQMENVRVSVDENTPYSFSSQDIEVGFTDSDSPYSVKILSIPYRGFLKNSGKEIVVGDIIYLSEIQDLQYIPPTDAFGIAYSSFKIQVNDNGLAPNPFSNTARVWIDISALQSPIVLGNTIEVMEGMDYQFNLLDFSIGYQDDTTNEPELIEVMTPNFGDLVVNGVIYPSNTFHKEDIGMIQYRPPSGKFADRFSFRVFDDQGLSSSIVDMMVDIKTLPSVSVITTNLCFGDSKNVFDNIVDNYENIDGSALKSIRITFIQEGYSLILSGVQVTVGQEVTLGDLSLLVNDESVASSNIEFRFVAISTNNKESQESTYIASVGSVADYDCEDYDNDDYFVF